MAASYSRAVDNRLRHSVVKPGQRRGRVSPRRRAHAGFLDPAPAHDQTVREPCGHRLALRARLSAAPPASLRQRRARGHASVRPSRRSAARLAPGSPARARQTPRCERRATVGASATAVLRHPGPAGTHREVPATRFGADRRGPQRLHHPTLSQDAADDGHAGAGRRVGLAPGAFRGGRSVAPARERIVWVVLLKR